MRAIWVTQHGGPEVLKIEELPKPEPSGSQVLVRVVAAGVNPIDTYMRSGAYANAKVPYTPGFDCAGTIEAMGPDIREFETGARVYTSSALSGTYAEFALCEAASVHPLPDNISFAQGAALGIPYATAYRALFQRAQARAGETVLVHGASGGVGTAAVQLARAAGLRVIGTSGTDSGRVSVLQNGAHHALDHTATNYAQELQSLTQNRGVDIILEMLANVNLGKDLAMLAKFGRVVVIGSRGTVEVNPRETMSRDATVIGMMLFNASPAELQSIHAALFAGLSNGTLTPIVGREFPLAEAPRAHEAVMAKGAHGKIVLLP